MAWTFFGTNHSCMLFPERGVLAEAFVTTTVSAYRGFSVPPDQSWTFSWDTVPLYSHSSNSSGFYSPAALKNLTTGIFGESVHTLDWEVGYTQTKSHHLRKFTTSQAQAIIAANPAMKVFVYQQGELASNYSDAERVAIEDPTKDAWWIHDLKGKLFTWDTGRPPFKPGYCEWGQRCARLLNVSVPAMRKWFVDKIVLPTLADPAVAGTFYDESMQLGQRPAPWIADGAAGAVQARRLQLDSAQLHREVGEAVLREHPGKRTLLSIQNIVFSDNYLPAGTSACSSHPSACAFVMSGRCPNGFGRTVYWADEAARTKAWVPHCDMCGLNICGMEHTMQNLTCAELDSLANVSDFECKDLPSPPTAGTKDLITEQELVKILGRIPWGRFYEGWPGYGWTNGKDHQDPAGCVAAVRNVQAEALAGIPVVTAFAYGANFRPFHDSSSFEKALAMYLMAAEKHSRFGYMNGYVCTDPNATLAPGLPINSSWSETSCTWLWRPELERPLGPPKSWARWDGRYRFHREFEKLNVSLDCMSGKANFSWYTGPR